MKLALRILTVLWSTPGPAYCPRCGTANNSNAAYCTGCGAKMS